MPIPDSPGAAVGQTLKKDVRCSSIAPRGRPGRGCRQRGALLLGHVWPGVPLWSRVNRSRAMPWSDKGQARDLRNTGACRNLDDHAKGPGDRRCSRRRAVGSRGCRDHSPCRLPYRGRPHGPGWAPRSSADRFEILRRLKTVDVAPWTRRGPIVMNPSRAASCRSEAVSIDRSGNTNRLPMIMNSARLASGVGRRCRTMPGEAGQTDR